MRTNAIIRTPASVPLHHRRDARLADQPISTMSRWGDATWRFDHEAPGRSAASVLIKWDYDLPDGTTLMDARHEPLLDAIRRFCWSLLCDPCEQAAPFAVTSLGALGTGLKTLVRWMVAKGHKNLTDLDRRALDEFKDDLPTILAGAAGTEDQDVECESAHAEIAGEVTAGRELSWVQAWNHLRIPSLIWRQRETLATAGIQVMPVEPWDAGELASNLAQKSDGQIMPIPSEVAIPVLNAAYRLLGAPADDVVGLVRQALELLQRESPGGYGKSPGKSLFARYRYANREISQFRFSTIAGEVEPWRPQLGLGTYETAWTASPTRTSPMHEIRTLVADIRNAATIVIQSTAGLRASELLSIPAGIDPVTGMPICIEIRSALSGLYEIFMLKSFTTKTEEVAREEEWVLGMRLVGSSDIPPAVRAIQVLQSLLDPFRSAMRNEAKLLVWFKSGYGLSTQRTNLAPCDNNTLSLGHKDFVVRNVDLSTIPDTSSRAIEENDLIPYRISRGQCIRPHQWRKTLAHFVFNTDNRLLPALSMQFKHISLAMTADDYLGHNQAVFHALDGVRAQETATMLFELATGKTLVAGRMGKQLEEHIEELRSSVRNLPRGEGWRRAMSLTIDKGIRLWFAPHGKCLPLRPSEMRCHQNAGTDHWLNRQPNYASREPSVCAGCSCFLVDERHLDFWKHRFVENWTAWKAAEREGRAVEFRVVLERANQARALLTSIGTDPQALVASRLDA